MATVIIAALHDVPDPEGYLAQRLYEILRGRQKAEFNAREALGRLRSNEKRIRFLVGAGARVHEQLLEIIRQRDALRGDHRELGGEA
jgi:hypothetical protein